MKLLLLTLVVAVVVAASSRTAMENPAAVSQIPQKIRKDYDKMWTRFLSGKEDAKLTQGSGQASPEAEDLRSVLDDSRISRSVSTATTLPLRQKFIQALAVNPKNRIAMYYLAEFAFANGSMLAPPRCTRN